jgi:hypothetical protein
MILTTQHPLKSTIYNQRITNYIKYWLSKVLCKVVMFNVVNFSSDLFPFTTKLKIRLFEDENAFSSLPETKLISV